MYERQFGLRENPFAAGHQSKYVYPSREHQEALAHLRFGIENREPFVLITGEVGTGKTTALYDALSEWKSRAVVALITNSALTRSELYEEICMRFGVPLSGPVSKPQLINQLERHLLVVRARGDFAILLIDEAQNLDDGLLEETRLLSNLETQGQKLLQIFLVGQPELEDKLAQPALRQLRQRIAVHYRLRPLSVEETTHYIHHRIAVAGGNAPQIFPPDAAAEVHRVTHGIPREINTVAAQALLNAFVEDSTSVRPEHVRAIVRDTGFQSVLDAAPAPSVAASAPSAPPDALTAVSPPPPAAAAAPIRENPASSPSAASPVPVSPDAPATTREVRPVPAPAPAPPRGPDETATRSTNAEGPIMAGVRPAGSTESWQSWMDSLAKQTEESVNDPAADAAGPESASADALPTAPEGLPAEMSPEAFDAVEQEALTSPIGGDDEEGEYEEAESDVESQVDVEPGFDPNESPGSQPWASIDTPAVPATTAHAPDFESAPGFQWDTPATARREDAPRETSWATPERPATHGPARIEAEPMQFDRDAMPAQASEPSAIDEGHDTLEASTGKPATPAPAPAAAAPAFTTKPRVAPIPAPTSPVAPALPMRLRERIEAAERAEAQQRGGATGWLIGAAVVAVIAVGAFFMMRARTPAKPAVTPTSAAAPATTSASETAPATGTAPSEQATPAGEESHAAPMAAPPAAVAPKPTPAKPAVTTAAATKPATEAPKHTESAKPAETAKSAAATPAAAPAKPAVAKGRYGVSVGTFLAEDRAKSESDRLAAATGMPGRVVAGSDGDFRVVLGSFPDRAAAEKAAGHLIGGGKVDEARVVPLK